MRYENRFAIVKGEGFLEGDVPRLYKTFEDAQRVCDSLNDSECWVDEVHDVMVTEESEKIRGVLDALRSAKKMLDGDATPAESVLREGLETVIKMAELVVTDLETSEKRGVERMAVTGPQLTEFCTRVAAGIPKFEGLVVWADFSKEHHESIRWSRSPSSLRISVPRTFKDAKPKAVEDFVGIALHRAAGMDASASKESLSLIQKSCTKDANRDAWMASRGFDADHIDWGLTDAARMAADDPVWAERLVVVMPDGIGNVQNSLLYLTIFADNDDDVIRGLAELRMRTDVFTGVA